MSDLELATIDELADEMRKRCVSVVCVWMVRRNDDYHTDLRSSGPRPIANGLIKYAQDAMDQSVDIQDIPSDDDEDDEAKAQ